MSAGHVEWIDLSRFLLDRQREFEGVRAAWEAAGSPPGFIIVEPDDDVVCDRCNAGIEEDQVAVLTSESDSKSALCVDCVLRWDAKRGRRPNQSTHEGV